MASLFAKIGFIRFWPKTMDYSKAFSLRTDNTPLTHTHPSNLTHTHTYTPHLYAVQCSVDDTRYVASTSQLQRMEVLVSVDQPSMRKGARGSGGEGRGGPGGEGRGGEGRGGRGGESKDAIGKGILRGAE